MATQIVQQSATIPFPVRTSEIIGQQELALLCSLYKRERQLAADIEAAEESLLARLQSGSTVEAGTFQAEIKVTERRNVSWKGVVIKKLGAAFAKRVLAATRPDTYTSLSIS
jgi:hypothetical protein